MTCGRQPVCCVRVACATAFAVDTRLDAESVRELGVKGDGTRDDTAGQQDTYVPPGRYLIGPAPLRVPPQTYLHGADREPACRRSRRQVGRCRPATVCVR